MGGALGGGSRCWATRARALGDCKLSAYCSEEDLGFGSRFILSTVLALYVKEFVKQETVDNKNSEIDLEIVFSASNVGQAWSYLRFKEDWGFQKCKPCLDCALVSRFQKANCSVTSDAVCGDCLPGVLTLFLWFSGASKVNLVKIPSTASSPRDTALAAVICSALATVLLALLILCIIYCKRQFMEKKPSWSLRAHDIQYNGSELSCFDRSGLNESTPRPCCQYHRDSAQSCGPVNLIPSLCCDEACSVDRLTLGCRVHSKATLQERNAGPVGEMMPAFFGSFTRSICGEFSDAWPLMQNPICDDDISFCDSSPELTGEDINSLIPENESSTSLDSNSSQDLVGGAVLIQAHSENFTKAADSSRHNNSQREPTLSQDILTTRSQLDQERGDIINLTTQTSIQVRQ
ncbi:Tumor necrosis factor receptor superfamily member 19 [Galemys pyrenaicus]|uniref:Tumor necrosis factor receptor superfamily member 19 n=1 Tax=Galemys pyrenaicus TaxID=202257 RepID=A0A8J6AL35_GALPY|nr:Tumor necrosis factor receptor superfamily member 19 [Galemys pyrenaicus]